MQRDATDDEEQQTRGHQQPSSNHTTHIFWHLSQAPAPCHPCRLLKLAFLACCFRLWRCRCRSYKAKSGFKRLVNETVGLSFRRAGNILQKSGCSIQSGREGLEAFPMGSSVFDNSSSSHPRTQGGDQDFRKLEQKSGVKTFLKPSVLFAAPISKLSSSSAVGCGTNTIPLEFPFSPKVLRASVDQSLTRAS